MNGVLKEVARQVIEQAATKLVMTPNDTGESSRSLRSVDPRLVATASGEA